MYSVVINGVFTLKYNNQRLFVKKKIRRVNFIIDQQLKDIIFETQHESNSSVIAFKIDNIQQPYGILNGEQVSIKLL